MGTRVSLGWGTPLDGILSGRICSAQQQISAERSLLLTPAPSRPALARTRAVGVGVIQFPRVGLGRCVPRLGAGVEHLSSASAEVGCRIGPARATRPVQPVARSLASTCDHIVTRIRPKPLARAVRPNYVHWVNKSG